MRGSYSKGIVAMIITSISPAARLRSSIAVTITARTPAR